MLIVDDWLKSKDAVQDEVSPNMTDESAARDRLKSIMNDNDSSIKTLLLRRICDFIAGMTDQYAMDCFERLYGVKNYDYR